jgi:hypothetical protein
MSTQPCYEPICNARADTLRLVITPQEHDLGGFSVRRVLPAADLRKVGPFVFFDEMGPAVFPPGQGIDVRPHPHIGIATVTYLFEGAIVHRDDLGHAQSIEAGAVNLMTAGRGIVHSERAGADRELRSTLHGIQSWMALPDGQEEIDPSFIHYPAATLPEFEHKGTTARIVMGKAYGLESPVQTYAPTLYMELRMRAGAHIELAADYEERAVYVVAGSIDVAGERFEHGVMLVARQNATLDLHCEADARLMVIGGDAMSERHLWWNFVAGNKARIERAKADWRDGNFGKIEGDDEFIPLPE